MDFHKLVNFLNFSGNEAGEQYFYFNGGIWSHGNAWYALALIANNEQKKAASFIKNIMSVKGIMDSPNGQPAMYEYRVSNPTDSTLYGQIDKPQFTWAAGWYIYSLYHLLGFRENAWNIYFDPYILDSEMESQFDVNIKGKLTRVYTKGNGDFIQKISYDRKMIPSLVVPEELENIKRIEFQFGEIEQPYIQKANSKLVSCKYDEKTKSLSAILQAFPNHKSKIEVVSPWQPRFIKQNETIIIDSLKVKKLNNVFEIKIPFWHEHLVDKIEVHF
jgi:hypothetical protein